MTRPAPRHRVLLVGATSAVASAVARRLAADGAALFCIARSEAKMDALAADLGPALQGRACFDFTDTERIEPAIEDAWAALGGVDLALVAHGLLPDQRATESEFAAAREAFDVNLTSAVAVLIPTSERMIAQGAGKLGAITSVAGDRGRPRNYTYGAAKGALSLYLQGLRSRLWDSGVEVYDFKLGPVVSPMTEHHRKNFSFTTVERAADEIVSALQTRRYERYVPRFWGAVMWAVRNMPEPVFQRLRFLSGPPEDGTITPDE